MYQPEHFKETDLDRLAALIDRYAFGMLVTVHDGEPFVSHIPFLYDKGVGAFGKLTGHVARANPQWQHLAQSQTVLAVFQGPHAYISPAWYDTPGVPTWNYAVAHLYGTPRLIEDEASLEALVERLTAVHEARFPVPWKPSLTGERRTKLLNMIVGFEIAITDIQGKFKLSQNRPSSDRRNVIEKLNESPNPLDIAVARLMMEGAPEKI